MARILIKKKKSVFIALSVAFVGAIPSSVQANSPGSIDSYKVLGAIAVTAATAFGIYAVARWHRTATNTSNTSNNIRTTPSNVSIAYLDVTNDSDLDAVMGIIKENQKDEEQLSLIRKLIKESCTLVVRVDNKIIGTATCTLGEGLLGTDCWIRCVAVKEGYQSQGYGAILMQHVMDELKNVKKIDSVGLSVDADNHRAQALYERNGFKKIGIRDITTGEVRICNFTWQGFKNSLGFRLLGFVPGIRFCV